MTKNLKIIHNLYACTSLYLFTPIYLIFRGFISPFSGEKQLIFFKIGIFYTIYRLYIVSLRMFRPGKALYNRLCNSLEKLVKHIVYYRVVDPKMLLNRQIFMDRPDIYRPVLQQYGVIWHGSMKMDGPCPGF